MNWTDTIKSIAPVLGTALGVPPLLMTGVRFIAEALGKPEATPTELEQLVTNGLTPEQIAAVQRADQDFAAKMRELDIRLDEINAGDRKSARDREVARGDNTTRNMAYTYTVGFFTALWAAWKFGIPIDARDYILPLLGVITTGQISILTYYFGSSSGSKQKTDAMAQALTSRG